MCLAVAQNRAGIRLFSRNLAGAVVARCSATLSLYPRLLGGHWSRVNPEIRAVHLAGSAGALEAKGSFMVRHGGGGLARLLVRLLKMPVEGDGVETRLRVLQEGAGERWCRTFADRRLSTVQYESGGLLAERFGLLELRFRLAVEGGALLYRQSGAFVGLGVLMLPLPKRISPQVSAREEPMAASRRVRSTVRVTLPLLGLLITYSGEIEPECVT